ARQSEQVASTAVAEGQGVVRAVSQEAADLAGTARERAAEVTGEVSHQARTVAEEARTSLQEQAQTQAQRLTSSLRELGEGVHALLEGRPDQAGTVADYARQASDRFDAVVDRLEDKGVEGVVDDLRDFARTRPGAFVLGAAVFGFGVGRLLRNSSGDDDEATQVGEGRPLAALPPAGRTTRRHGATGTGTTATSPRRAGTAGGTRSRPRAATGGR
ncbi:MAG TPA: hypothetical protein VFO65_13940, partial [Acidimicrobiales bacterium]|nr:hypothetical protein [Acidimicrobiales bacterium]